LLLLVLVVGIAAYWYLVYFKPGMKEASSPTVTETKLIKKTETTGDSSPSGQMNEMPESENTPSEINNQAVDEMDQIILSVDGSEDLSDL
jgi:hypothetical protein